jgi:hypothetical protein
VPQPVKVDRILVSARDRRHALHHHLEHLMQNAVRIAAIRHRRRKPPAHTKLALRLAQQQQAGIGGLGAAVEIYCEFLAVDGWQVERERRIVGHGGCGFALIARGKRWDTDLLRESAPSRYSRRKISTADA